MKLSEEINIFQDVAFKLLRNVCDSIFKRLHSKGIGTEAKATLVMSVNEEDVLWNIKILDLDIYPNRSVVGSCFIMGKTFAYGEARSKGI